ncbi:hypothetical protein [uncultured Roseovarius sp.]|uniref:hypothetical protein n=1 Tax=uncultured Roseovarius sp. TaxID=293344 RepID=UPI00262E58EB|nr:hypothetical protein [uncultured Roseovarius sp.]
MRLLALFLILITGVASAQTREVNPADLTLTVSIENGNVTPYQQEMVLVTIHGIYRRHITREKLEQPLLDGFNWMQLGQDHWYESQMDGKKVKNFKRRMALFPDRTGKLEIGPFVHHLTLTDEGDDWFGHDIQSEPISIRVAPAPVTDGWWFPTRRLEISDQWSNAPDQLADGEGVLRVIRITAVGVSPDMIPPMPALSSPSAMIFPHPEKRLVELSPQGPVSIAFWRWTIRPTNGASAILEPIKFNYFDTITRQVHEVTITAQRVAMKAANSPSAATTNSAPSDAQLHPWFLFSTGATATLAGLVAMIFGRRFDGRTALARFPLFNPTRRALRRAARTGDLPGVRRAAADLIRQEGATPEHQRLLNDFDRAVFGPNGPGELDLRGFARQLLSCKPTATIQQANRPPVVRDGTAAKTATPIR